jgi:hypothetical protein
VGTWGGEGRERERERERESERVPNDTLVPGFALHENTCLYEQVLPASPASPAEREKEREKEREYLKA